MVPVGRSSADSPARYRTEGLGTSVEMLVTDRSGLVTAASILHQELELIDRLASRFRYDSEISRLHRAGGAPVRVSPELFDCIRLTLTMAEATDGALDPTVGEALCRLGYDRDFSEVANGVPGYLPSAAPVPGWRSIDIDPERGTIRIPEGTQVDLGATAKALTADRSARRAALAAGCGVLISLGGDIACAGPPPPDGFRVGLADVCTDLDTDETVAITSGGLATSGVGARHWRLGDQVVHHIIDPTTGLSAATPWRTVTVAAATCVEANAAATASVVKGSGAVEWLSSLLLPARLVAFDKVRHCTPGWPEGDQVGLTPQRLAV